MRDMAISLESFEEAEKNNFYRQAVYTEVIIDNQSSAVFIIQGKFYSEDTVNAEPLREILSSWIQIKDLAHLQEGTNQRLQVKISEMAAALEDDCEICFELITASELTESAKADLAALQKELGTC